MNFVLKIEGMARRQLQAQASTCCPSRSPATLRNWGEMDATSHARRSVTPSGR